MSCDDAFRAMRIRPTLSGGKLVLEGVHCQSADDKVTTFRPVYDAENDRLYFEGLANQTAANRAVIGRTSADASHLDGNDIPIFAGESLTFCEPCEPACWECDGSERTTIREDVESAETLTLTITDFPGAYCASILEGVEVELSACGSLDYYGKENFCICGCDDLRPGANIGGVLARWVGNHSIPGTTDWDGENLRLAVEAQVVCYIDKTATPWVCEYYLIVRLVFSSPILDSFPPAINECCAAPLEPGEYGDKSTSWIGCGPLVFDELCGVLNEDMMLVSCDGFDPPGAPCNPNECEIIINITGVAP